jgi:broad specificity phosphatase PhoE
LEGTPWDTESHIDDLDGVETLSAVLARAHETLTFVSSLPYENILIASHGTFGLALQAAIQGEPTFQDVDGIPNAEVIRFI